MVQMETKQLWCALKSFGKRCDGATRTWIKIKAKCIKIKAKGARGQSSQQIDQSEAASLRIKVSGSLAFCIQREANSNNLLGMEILDDFACLLNGLDTIIPRIPGRSRPKDVEFNVGGVDSNVLKVRRYGTEHTLFTRGESMTSCCLSESSNFTGQVVDRVIFVINGRIHCKGLDLNPAAAISRSSLVDTLADFTGRLRPESDTFRGGGITSPTLHARTLHVYGRGDVLGLSPFLTNRRSEWDLCDLVVVASSEPCYTVEVDHAVVSGEADREKIMLWVAKAGAILTERAVREFLDLSSI